MTIELIKFLGLSVGPVLTLGLLFFVFGNKKGEKQNKNPLLDKKSKSMIKIVSRDYCPYCDMAKQLIESLGFEYEEIDVSNDQGKLQEIVSISRMMTVPQIFAGDIKLENLLGGYSEIEKLNEKGELLQILENNK